MEGMTLDVRLSSIEARLEQLLKMVKPERELATYLCLEEAADLICKSVHTLYGLVSRREIPHIKKGNRLYFKEDDLRSWLEAGERQVIQ